VSTAGHREVSVVVITRDRWPELCVTLAHLLALPERPAVIVVDNGSSDGTPAYLRRRFPEVTAIPLAANAGASARTIGARAATTEFVAFADDDSWWDPGALGRGLELMAADPALALLAAAVVVGTDRSPDPIGRLMAAGPRDEWLRASMTGRRGVTGFLACAALVRRHAFLAVGGFEPRFVIGAEETLLTMDLAAAGWKAVYAPELTAWHQPSARRETLRRERQVLRNELLTTWLRRRRATAVVATGAAVARAARRPRLLPALTDAVGGLMWVAVRRRPLSRALDDAFVSS
jgi:GT2 family glycosyltransferase